MNDFYLHNFVFTGKDAGGTKFKDLVLQVLDECGVPHDCPCPTNCTTLVNPVTQRKKSTTKSIEMSIGALISYIETLEARIVALGG